MYRHPIYIHHPVWHTQHYSIPTPAQDTPRILHTHHSNVPHTQPSNISSSVHLYNNSCIQNPAHIRIEPYTQLPACTPVWLHTRYPIFLQWVHTALHPPTAEPPHPYNLRRPHPQTSGPRNALLEVGWSPQADWALGSFLEPGGFMCQFRELPRQGSPTWPLWLLSLGGMWARSKEAGAAPTLPHPSWAAQYLTYPGPSSTSPWPPSSCFQTFQSWGSTAHIRHSGFHLCPEFCSLL